jgi:hypothetical protein
VQGGDIQVQRKSCAKKEKIKKKEEEKTGKQKERR